MSRLGAMGGRLYRGEDSVEFVARRPAASALLAQSASAGYRGFEPRGPVSPRPCGRCR